MIQVLETTDPAADDNILDLQVYVGSDGKTVMAHAAHPARIHGNQATWPIIIQFGTPVREAYEMALALAEQNGISRVRINDPQGLFPPTVRPRAASRSNN